MKTNQIRVVMLGNGARAMGSPAAPRTFLGKVLAAITGIVVLIGAFVFSVIVFAIVAALVLVIAGVVLWKTRKLRRELRERAAAAQRTGGAPPPPSGRVFEGEVIRDNIQ